MVDNDASEQEPVVLFGAAQLVSHAVDELRWDHSGWCANAGVTEQTLADLWLHPSRSQHVTGIPRWP